MYCLGSSAHHDVVCVSHYQNCSFSSPHNVWSDHAVCGWSPTTITHVLLVNSKPLHTSSDSGDWCLVVCVFYLGALCTGLHCYRNITSWWLGSTITLGNVEDGTTAVGWSPIISEPTVHLVFVLSHRLHQRHCPSHKFLNLFPLKNWRKTTSY